MTSTEPSINLDAYTAASLAHQHTAETLVAETETVIDQLIRHAYPTATGLTVDGYLNEYGDPIVRVHAVHAGDTVLDSWDTYNATGGRDGHDFAEWADTLDEWLDQLGALTGDDYLGNAKTYTITRHRHGPRFYVISETHGLVGVARTQDYAEQLALIAAVNNGRTIHVHDRATEGK